MSPNLDRFLPIADVLQIVRLSRATIWRLEKRGEFPRRVHIGLRRIGVARERNFALDSANVASVPPSC